MCHINTYFLFFGCDQKQDSFVSMKYHFVHFELAHTVQHDGLQMGSKDDLYIKHYKTMRF